MEEKSGSGRSKSLLALGDRRDQTQDYDQTC